MPEDTLQRAVQNGWTDQDAVWFLDLGGPNEAAAMRPYVKLLWRLVVIAVVITTVFAPSRNRARLASATNLSKSVERVGKWRGSVCRRLNFCSCFQDTRTAKPVFKGITWCLDTLCTVGVDWRIHQTLVCPEVNAVAIPVSSCCRSPLLRSQPTLCLKNVMSPTYINRFW